MNELQIFQNKEFGEVRSLVINNEPWFVGKDVAEALGYKDVNHAILDHVDEEDKVNSKTQGQNAPELGQRGSWLINESGLYSLILSSKLPNAKKFKRWVTSEVLPTLRKTGSYAKATVIRTLGGVDSRAYQLMSRKIFSNIWRDYKNYFKLGSFRDTLKTEFENAKEYLESWSPEVNVSLKIKEYNSQLSMNLDA
jgi:hypothetical protein